jgi:hypothetical protein
MIGLKRFKENFTSKKSLIIRYTGFVSAIFIGFLIPTYVWFIPPFMILWGVAWILETRDLHRKTILIPDKLPLLIFILFMSYYLWQFAGLVYSSEKITGVRFFFSRLSLLIFPLVLFVPGEKIKTNCLTLVRIFAFATFLYVALCYGLAFYRSISLDNGHIIFNQHPP